MQTFFWTYLLDFFTLVCFAYVLTFWERTSFQVSLPQMLSENEFESHMHKNEEIELFQIFSGNHARSPSPPESRKKMGYSLSCPVHTEHPMSSGKLTGTKPQHVCKIAFKIIMNNKFKKCAVCS